MSKKSSSYREPIPGESEWSQEHRLPADEIPAKEKVAVLPDPELQALALERLAHHPDLTTSQLDVQVDNSCVSVQGRVPSEAAKMVIDELVRALPGAAAIRNEVKVDKANL